jgi:hypothetical protein
MQYGESYGNACVARNNRQGRRLLPQYHSYPNYYANLAFFWLPTVPSERRRSSFRAPGLMVRRPRVSFGTGFATALRLAVHLSFLSSFSKSVCDQQGLDDDHGSSLGQVEIAVLPLVSEYLVPHQHQLLRGPQQHGLYGHVRRVSRQIFFSIHTRSCQLITA